MKTLVIGSDGYIGSRLIEVLKADGVDDNFLFSDYSDWIGAYDTIVLLAGVSSVAMSNRLPNLAWNNNVEYFRKTLNKLTNKQRLIYASSASVYNGIQGGVDEEERTFNLQGMYDLTKYTIDNLALLSGKNFYGLRFATVNGYSPNLRVDVMMNKMAYDARESGVITVANADLQRPILGIEDLCRAIKTIVDTPNAEPGIYNLASFSKRVIEMAELVADRYDATIADVGAVPSYVFGVSTAKFERNFGFEFNDTVETILDSLDGEWEAICQRV